MAAISPVRCQRCQKPLRLEGRIIGIRFFHPECFKCDLCAKNLERSCFEDGPNLMCEPCFTSRFIRKCAQCKKPIEEKGSELFGQSYHRTCGPVCHRCGKPPADHQYVETTDKKPSCIECFWMTIRDGSSKKEQQKSQNAVVAK